MENWRLICPDFTPDWARIANMDLRCFMRWNVRSQEGGITDDDSFTREAVCGESARTV